MNDVFLVPTGIANTASVTAAFARLGVRVRTSVAVNELERAAAVVLPGVGAFAAGAAQLRDLGIDRVLAARIASGRGTLAICLGMQLCCEASEESTGVEGLGIVPGVVRAFPPTVRSPQLGWNRVQAVGEPWCEEGFAYFANGYRLVEVPPGWSSATTDHGGPFCSALRRGAAWMFQFHPEISGSYGARLLKAWLAACAEEKRC